MSDTNTNHEVVKSVMYSPEGEDGQRQKIYLETGMNSVIDENGKPLSEVISENNTALLDKLNNIETTLANLISVVSTINNVPPPSFIPWLKEGQSPMYVVDSMRPSEIQPDLYTHSVTAISSFSGSVLVIFSLFDDENVENHVYDAYDIWIIRSMRDYQNVNLNWGATTFITPDMFSIPAKSTMDILNVPIEFLDENGEVVPSKITPPFIYMRNYTPKEIMTEKNKTESYNISNFVAIPVSVQQGEVIKVVFQRKTIDGNGYTQESQIRYNFSNVNDEEHPDEGYL